MNPPDLGLPPKFSVWRPHQLDAVIAAVASNERFVIINAPTGLGKSAIGMAAHAMVGGRTLDLTRTKGLQHQMTADFHTMGMVDIKGQNNYGCLYFEEDDPRNLPTCDEGPCHAGVECLLRDGGCYYYDAVRRAARSRLVITNYDYWMSINRYAEPGTIGRFDLLILDEAHEAANALADFVRVDLDRKEVWRLLQMRTPVMADIDEWVAWADEALKVLSVRLDAARQSAIMFHRGVTVVKRLIELDATLRGLLQSKHWRRVDAPDPPAWVPGITTDWIIEEEKDRVTFQPVWASGYAEDYLFAGIQKVILLSATVTDKDAAYLGIRQGEYKFKQYPSPFARAIRPVWFVPTIKVGRDMTNGEQKVWVNRIDQLIDLEMEQGESKGIIFTMSYHQAREIYARSRHKDILFIHDRMSMRDTIDDFRRSAPPAVLISPSVGTGWDFPFDDARFQIIAKLPFIDSRPLIIRARHRADKRYLDHVTVTEIIQRCGRAVRSESDWARTYIVDDNWGWFWSRNNKLFPKWFRMAVRKVGSTELEREIRATNRERALAHRSIGR